MPPAEDRRHFLSWERPLLPQAVAFLAKDWTGEGPLDLSRLLVIVPTRQSGRRLREALADYAKQHGQGVFAPRVMTPEVLLGANPADTVASRPDSLIAWSRVLQDLSIDEFREVFPVDPPARDFSWALRLAREFYALQVALAENGLRIADVATKIGDGFPEQLRWRQLAQLERLQAQRLERAGMTDAPATRIRQAQQPWLTGIDWIVLLAAPDPLPLALSALQVHAGLIRTDVVVFAPKEEKHYFDEWGRPAIEGWEKRLLTLEAFESQVHLCSDPVEQAERLTAVVSQYAEPEGIVAFGIADPEIGPPLESALERHRIPSFSPDGNPRKKEGLYQLLSSLAALMREPVYAHVEALARCPDFIFYLRGKSEGSFSVADWLAGLDQLRAKHLPADLSAALQQAAKPGNRIEVLNGLKAMRALHDGARQNTFEATVTAMLNELFRDRKLDLKSDDDQRFENAALAWMECVRDCVRAREGFGDMPVGDWWELALQLFAESVQTDDKPEGALELQGWLELAWENAPHLLVGGLNDGRVPEAVVGDAFLPESLRARLGLATNRTRFARDAYLLQALVSSRKDGGRLDLFFGKTSLAGEPLRPSRLLLRCADEELPSRVSYLFGAPEKNEQPLAWTRAWQLHPRRENPPARVAVTGLRAWLACPFRFYLSYVLKMKPVDPAKNELDALDFGTLCHAALEGLAGVAMRDCADERTLRDFLLSEFDRQVGDRYGAELSLPLLVQLESARQRLSKVAEVQAVERAEGWVIIDVEKKIEINCDGIVVSGRIDRIEKNEKTGRTRVLDYKTSDAAVSPRDAHLRSRRTDESPPEWARIEVDGRERVWADLQLPLYRFALATEFGPDVTFGYFNLPKAAGEAGLQPWEDFSVELQESAMRCAQGICAAIKAGVFWPPNEKVRAEYDDFAALFQHGVAASVAWEAVP